jgi:hypothetical protein
VPAPLSAIVSIDLLSGGGEPGRHSAFLVLLAFLVTFLFIRTSARMIRAEVSWWPGNVETSSGLHLHHLVWGISLMTLSGFIAFALPPQDPWWQIVAIAFGIGAGLTFDEFALWIHLEDVYWSEQGRSSVDAVVIVTIFMLLVAVGTRPFGLDEPESLVPTILIVVQAVVLSGISFLKGRIVLGVVAIFIPFFGLWASLRLAKPGSPWAHRFYEGRRPHKLERARARYRSDRRSVRLRREALDAIGGRPTGEEDPPKTPQDPASTGERSG